MRGQSHTRPRKAGGCAVVAAEDRGGARRSSPVGRVLTPRRPYLGDRASCPASPPPAAWSGQTKSLRSTQPVTALPDFLSTRTSFPRPPPRDRLESTTRAGWASQHPSPSAASRYDAPKPLPTSSSTPHQNQGRFFCWCSRHPRDRDARAPARNRAGSRRRRRPVLVEGGRTPLPPLERRGRGSRSRGAAWANGGT